MSTAPAPGPTSRPIAEGRSIWVSGKAICDALSVSYKRLHVLVGDGLIGVRALPGCHPRYNLADALKLAERA